MSTNENNKTEKLVRETTRPTMVRRTVRAALTKIQSWINAMRLSTRWKFSRAGCWTRDQIDRAGKSILHLLGRAGDAVAQFLAWYNHFEYGDMDDDQQ